MIKNYFKIAWRNIWKNKVFSGINIIGLAVGMAAFMIIMLFVAYEKSFDNFHTRNIYRLNEVLTVGSEGMTQKVALSMFPMGGALKQEYPEIKNYTRIHWDMKYQMTYNEKRIFMPAMFFVDSTFFKIFDFKVLRGDINTALQKPHSVMLTEETAKSLFGDTDPMGKTLVMNNTINYTVTGIVPDFQKNVTLQFNWLAAHQAVILLLYAGEPLAIDSRHPDHCRGQGALRVETLIFAYSADALEPQLFNCACARRC